MFVSSFDVVIIGPRNISVYRRTDISEFTWRFIFGEYTVTSYFKVAILSQRV